MSYWWSTVLLERSSLTLESVTTVVVIKINSATLLNSKGLETYLQPLSIESQRLGAQPPAEERQDGV